MNTEQPDRARLLSITYVLVVVLVHAAHELRHALWPRLSACRHPSSDQQLERLSYARSLPNRRSNRSEFGLY